MVERLGIAEIGDRSTAKDTQRAARYLRARARGRASDVQTFVEPTLELRMLVDAFPTCDYVELPMQPTIAIVAGPGDLESRIANAAAHRRSLLARLQGRGQMGQPSDQVGCVQRARSCAPASGLATHSLLGFSR
jgi:hypothetical protein